jgi:cardiolipin synthase
MATSPQAIRPCDVDGNRLTLFTEGPERLEALVGLIDGAKTSVRLLYYMYRDDSAGEQVYAAMERAIDRGVAVSLLIDGFGAFVRDEYFTPLTEKGLRYCRFNPTFGRRYLIRCHQKMTLVDDRRAMIGGFNVEQDYFAPAGQPGHGAISACWSTDPQPRALSLIMMTSFTGLRPRAARSGRSTG